MTDLDKTIDGFAYWIENEKKRSLLYSVESLQKNYETAAKQESD